MVKTAYVVGHYYKRQYDDVLYAVFQVMSINQQLPDPHMIVKLITDYGEQFKKENSANQGYAYDATYGISAVAQAAGSLGSVSCASNSINMTLKPIKKAELRYNAYEDSRDTEITEAEAVFELI